MPDAELAHRPGVELVNVGNWRVLSGSWSPNRKDILAAVDAAQCPAVRRPKLKLGHLDPRFNQPDDAQHDGTPSLGWFDNLRASDDGNTLIGDQVALPWLSQVQAAAYPDRSVEGTHNARCALGHVHPFVVTAVSLLGETPPGIPTLKSIKSIDDLPAALGVAASGEDTEGGEDVQATVRAATEPAPDGDQDEDDEPTGAMVALIPTAEDAARLAVDGGEPAEQLHLTLAYLGDAADLDTSARQDLIDAVSTAVNGMPVVEAEIFSAAVYNPGDTSDRDTCLVYQVSGALLDAVHCALDDALDGVDQGSEPWFAHVTALWSDDLARLGDLTANMGPVSFDRLRIAVAGQTVDIPLIDNPQPAPAMPNTGSVYAANTPAGNADRLKQYWLAGPGLAKWADAPHPWTTLYRLLLKHIKNPDEARRTASQWYREHFGHMPNQKPGVKASGQKLTVTWKPGSTEESLMDAFRSLIKAGYGPSPDLPAAEPEQENTEPKEEDHVSDLSAFRSRLGLDDTADEQAILSALDDLKTKADTPATGEPTPEMVAASAAATKKAEDAEAEKDELRKEVQILASQMKTVSDELASSKAAEAATVKASVFTAAIKDGKIKPAEREQWETDYDEAPGAVTRVLAAIAVGTAVPVLASGTAGSGEPNFDDDFEAMIARIDAPTGKVA